MNRFSRVLLSPLAPLLLTAIVLLPALRIGFVNDDLTVVTYAFTDWKPDPAKLATKQEVVDLYYRPLVDLTFGIDYFFWGLDPVGYRLTNLLIHLLNVWLVYGLARRLIGEGAVPGLAAAIFGLLPVHETSIYWIPGRTDMLCASFYLGAIHLLLIHLRDRNRLALIGSLVAALCAMLSKEMAMSLPLTAMLTTAWLLHGSGERVGIGRLLRIGLPYLVVVLGVFVARIILLENNILSMPQGLHANAGPLNIARNIATYIGLLVIPTGHYSLERLLSAYPGPIVAVALLAIVAACVMLWRTRTKAAPAIFSLLWILLTLIPVSRLAMRWYLYIPSVGFSLGLGWLLGRATVRRRAAAGIAGAVLLLYAVVMVESALDWTEAGRVSEKLIDDLKAAKPSSRGRDTIVFANTLGKIGTVPVFHLGMEKTLRRAYGNDSLTVLIWSRSVLKEYPSTSIRSSVTGDTILLESGGEDYFTVQNRELLLKKRTAEPGVTTTTGDAVINVADVDPDNKPVRITIVPEGTPPAPLFIFDGKNFKGVEE